jgi:hypothetical protein
LISQSDFNNNRQRTVHISCADKNGAPVSTFLLFGRFAVWSFADDGDDIPLDQHQLDQRRRRFRTKSNFKLKSNNNVTTQQTVGRRTSELSLDWRSDMPTFSRSGMKNSCNPIFLLSIELLNLCLDTVCQK